MYSLHHQFFLLCVSSEDSYCICTGSSEPSLHAYVICETKARVLANFLASCCCFCVWHGRIQRGTGGPDPPPHKNHKNIEFLCNTGQDPLENHKAARSAFNVGPSTVCWRAYDRPLKVVFGSSPPFINLKKKHYQS